MTDNSVNLMLMLLSILTCYMTVQSLKLHKAAGHDCISNEHIIYGSSCLKVHVCLQAAFYMPMILFYYQVAFMVYKKCWTYVASMEFSLTYDFIH